jgi:hypothetical protein
MHVVVVSVRPFWGLSFWLLLLLLLEVVVVVPVVGLNVSCEVMAVMFVNPRWFGILVLSVTPPNGTA